ncbi:MAG: DUF839 domain-containing protein [Myxococcales bacterium]|nr:DUF839 domain-containing protein [Myxococcales bacterium]
MRTPVPRPLARPLARPVVRPLALLGGLVASLAGARALPACHHTTSGQVEAPRANPPAVDGPPSLTKRALSVAGVPVPSGEAQRAVQASSQATLDGRPFAIGFQALARTGDRIGSGVFGARVSRSGAPLGLCEGLDYTGIWQSTAGLSMISHFECQPGAIYMTALDQAADGALLATSTRAVDTRPIDGGNTFCAGTETSWDTHLAGEEYEGDVRKLLPDGTLSDNFEDYNELSGWWDGGLGEAHPWLYGWMIEVPSTGPAARRWAMGRFSHELGVVMPDDRTVYMTDDTATAGGFFLYQTDTPRDLTAGTLYAAQWSAEQSNGEGGGYDVRWVSLGHATDAEVEAFVARREPFTALYDVAEPDGTRCPEGLEFVRVSWGPECLRVRPGMEGVASRLESRRSAALAGATTEFIKTEGLAYAPETHTLFMAMTRMDKGVTAADPIWDAAGRDDLNEQRNLCGGVWAMDVGTGPPGGPQGEYVATRASLLLAGQPDGDRCADDGIANPDNLAWLTGMGTLAVAEDTGRHVNNALWLYDVQSKGLTRAMTVPRGAEVSGLRWTEGVGGYSYLSVSVQHPLSKDPAATEAERHSIAGVYGPFPERP